MKQRKFKKFDIVRPSKEWNATLNNGSVEIIDFSDWDPLCLKPNDVPDLTNNIGVVDYLQYGGKCASVRWFSKKNGLPAAWWNIGELDIIGNAIE